MAFVIFVERWISENAEDAIRAAINFPDFRVALLTESPPTLLDSTVRNKLVAWLRIPNVRDSKCIVSGAKTLAKRFGEITQLIGVGEYEQIAIAQARHQLDINGIPPRTAKNFRDKFQMKQLLLAAGVPCAQYALVRSLLGARQFVKKVGYPIIIKPRAEAMATATFKIEDDLSMQRILGKLLLQFSSGVLVEEYIVGDEYSCESFWCKGAAMWHSGTRYLPKPLDAIQNSGIQWCALLPRERLSPEFLDAYRVAQQAGNALGIKSGVTHMEWFRKLDGSILLSEIAARPPGAKIPALVSCAHETDFMSTWIRAMVFNDFQIPPPRKYASGVVFLRGKKKGVITSIQGIRRIKPVVAKLIVSKQLPIRGRNSMHKNYEGDGYIVLRSKKTEIIEEKLSYLANEIYVKTSN